MNLMGIHQIYELSQLRTNQTSDFHIRIPQDFLYNNQHQQHRDFFSQMSG